MEETQILPHDGAQIAQHLRELINLVLPLHALLNDSSDEASQRMKEMIEALTLISISMQKTVESLNKERSAFSTALEAKFETIQQNQDIQMQLLTDFQAWLGVPQPQTAAPRS